MVHNDSLFNNAPTANKGDSICVKKERKPQPETAFN